MTDDDLSSHYLAFTGRRPTRDERAAFTDDPESFRSLALRLSMETGFKESPIYLAHGHHYEKEVEYFGIGVDSRVGRFAITSGILDNLDRIEFARTLLYALSILGSQESTGSPG